MNQLKKTAERKGFEPSIRFPVYTLSRRAPSTTRTPLCFPFGGAKLAIPKLFSEYFQGICRSNGGYLLQGTLAYFT